MCMCVLLTCAFFFPAFFFYIRLSLSLSSITISNVSNDS